MVSGNSDADLKLLYIIFMSIGCGLSNINLSVILDYFVFLMAGVSNSGMFLYVTLDYLIMVGLDNLLEETS